MSSICIFVDRLNGGGAERVLINLANQISKVYDVDLVVATNRASLEDLVSKRVRTIHLGASRAASSVRRFSLYMNESNPEVIISGKVNSNAVAVLSRAMSKSSPYLMLTEHSLIKTNRTHGWKGIIEKFIIQNLYHRSDKIVAVSEQSLAELRSAINLKHVKTVAISNPVIGDRFDEEYKSAVPIDHNPECKTILAMGRLEAVKGFDDLIRGFAEIEKSKNFQLIILGEGSNRPRLELLVRSLNLQDKVMMPGFQSNPLPYLKRCDVFCMSSHAESFGNVIIEAIASRSVVVARNSPGGAREILEGASNKIVLTDFSPRRIAAALELAVDLSNTRKTELNLEPYKITYVARKYLDQIPKHRMAKIEYKNKAL